MDGGAAERSADSARSNLHRILQEVEYYADLYALYSVTKCLQFDSPFRCLKYFYKRNQDFAQNMCKDAWLSAGHMVSRDAVILIASSIRRLLAIPADTCYNGKKETR